MQRTTSPIATISPEVLLRLGADMGRWKGEQHGILERRKTGWFGRWREHVIKADGSIKWDQITKKLLPVYDSNKKAYTKADAQEALNERLALANGPAAVRQNMATFRQFVDIRFRPGHIEHLEKSTRIQYESLLKNHILPAFGDQRMRDITGPLLQLWVNAKVKEKRKLPDGTEKSLSPQTVRTCFVIVQAVFKHADECGFWRGDLPTQRVRLPKMKRVRESIALTEVQVAAILAHLVEPTRTLVLALALTGMRIGEAVGLHWSHVNLTDEPKLCGRESLPGRTIAVRKNYTHGEMKDSPKTIAGARNIPIAPVLWAALFAIRGDEGLVFPNKKGEPLDAHNIANRELLQACAAAGLPRLGFHVFRHTLATLAQQKGMSVAEVRDVLGHAANAMTMNYTHGSLDRARDVLGKLDMGTKAVQ